MVLVLGLLLIPSLVESASGIDVVDKTGDGIWDGNTWQVNIYPGEVKSTTISLYNSYGGSLEVEASVLPDSLDDGNLAFELDKTSFTMPGDSYADVTLTVRVSGSTTPGSYTAELEIVSEVTPTTTPTPAIDIKPGSDPNSINLKSKGVVPVAVLTTDDFDASTIDPDTLVFAGASPVRWTLEDVDDDGDLDLLVHFKTQDLNLDEDSTEATLTGETDIGQTIEGTDTVNIVPKGK